MTALTAEQRLERRAMRHLALSLEGVRASLQAAEMRALAHWLHTWTVEHPHTRTDYTRAAAAYLLIGAAMHAKPGEVPHDDLDVAFAQFAREGEPQADGIDVNAAGLLQLYAETCDDVAAVEQRLTAFEAYLDREPLARRQDVLVPLGLAAYRVCKNVESYEGRDACAARFLVQLRRATAPVGGDAAAAWAHMVRRAACLDDDAARCHERGEAILAFARECPEHDTPEVVEAAAHCWSRASEVDEDSQRRVARAEALEALFAAGPTKCNERFVSALVAALERATHESDDPDWCFAIAARIRGYIGSVPIVFDIDHTFWFARSAEGQGFSLLARAIRDEESPTKCQELAIEYDARIAERLGDVHPIVLAFGAFAWRTAAIGAHRTFVERGIARVKSYRDAVDDEEERASIETNLEGLRCLLQDLRRLS
jgi:hypothetical protein